MKNTTRTTLTVALLDAIAVSYVHERSVTAAARKHGVPSGTLSRWLARGHAEPRRSVSLHRRLVVAISWADSEKALNELRAVVAEHKAQQAAARTIEGR